MPCCLAQWHRIGPGNRHLLLQPLMQLHPDLMWTALPDPTAYCLTQPPSISIRHPNPPIALHLVILTHFALQEPAAPPAAATGVQFAASATDSSKEAPGNAQASGLPPLKPNAARKLARRSQSSATSEITPVDEDAPLEVGMDCHLALGSGSSGRDLPVDPLSCALMPDEARCQLA